MSTTPPQGEGASGESRAGGGLRAGPGSSRGGDCRALPIGPHAPDRLRIRPSRRRPGRAHRGFAVVPGSGCRRSWGAVRGADGGSAASRWGRGGVRGRRWAGLGGHRALGGHAGRASGRRPHVGTHEWEASASSPERPRASGRIPSCKLLESEVSDRDKERIAILIAGMHRSGTSTLTRVLNVVGCASPTDVDPTAGRWKSGKIVHLNDEILASAGSSWRDWTSFDPQWYASPAAGRFRRRARETLEGAFGDSPFLALDDPRICRLLPFWIEAVRACGAEPAIVSPVRNSLDVASSLEERDGIDPSIGHLLWLRHVLDAEKDTRGMKRAWLRHDALFSEPSAMVKILGDALGISWPMVDSTGSMIEVDRSIHGDLLHHRSNDAAPPGDPGLSGWFTSSFDILDRWARGDARDEDVEELDRIRTDFDAATPVLSRVLASSARAMAERDRRIKGLNEAVVLANERIELLTREMGDRDRIIEALYGSMIMIRRITSPLRRGRERARHVLAKGQAGAGRIARTVCHGTPLPYSFKLRIKGSLFRSIPFLFKHTAAWRERSAHNPVPHPPDRVGARATRSTPDGDGAGAERRG